MLTFFRRLIAFFRRDGMAADLEEEMRLHLELRAAELERQGMRRSDAMDAARRRFGNVTLMQETSTDMWGGAPLDRLRQDVRFAIRRIRQNPGLDRKSVV